MARRTSVGMGYRHSEMNRSLWTTGDSNILTRLASRSVTGQTLPIQVHQHYGLELHLLLTDDSCICRDCWSGENARRICTQLERKLEGLCSCVFDVSSVLTLSNKVEQCFRALPAPDLFRTPCDCDTCTAFIAPRSRWLTKNKQAEFHSQRDICCCRIDHVEVLC